MFNRILVPLDGSKLAERTISHAITTARLSNAKVFLLHILDPTQHNDSLNAVEPFNWQLRKAEAELYLQEVGRSIREQQVDVDYAILEGRTAESIIDYAQQEKMDLIVLCTHGANGFSRWNMSSVVAKVIERAYLPLFVIRSYQEFGTEETESQGQGARSSALYRRILVPIDSSRRAECALPAATLFAKGPVSTGGLSRQPAIVLAAVIKPPDLPIPSPYSAEINQTVQSLMRVSRDAASEYLAELQATISAPCETRIVENSSIPAAIHALAAEEDIDLVILCAHGQTGPVAWPYGSVAWNYLQHGEKHVLLIQDIHPSQVRPTAAEAAAEKYGRR